MAITRRGISREYFEQKLAEYEDFRHEVRVAIADGSIDAFDGKYFLDGVDEKERKLRARFCIQVADFMSDRIAKHRDRQREFKLAHTVYKQAQLAERRQQIAHDSASDPPKGKA